MVVRQLHSLELHVLCEQAGRQAGGWLVGEL